MSKFKVGEDVMLGTAYSGYRRFPVEKVGRKYVTVQRKRFHIENGQGDYGHIETLAEFDERQARDEAVRVLAALGVDLRYGSLARKSAVDVLFALRPVLTSA